MELCEWYIDRKPDKKQTRVVKLEIPLSLGRDARIEFTLNHQIMELHQVFANDMIPMKFSLTSWKTGKVAIELPSHLNHIMVYEVSIEWS